MDSAFSDASAMLMNGQLGCFVGGTFLMGNFVKENFDVGIAQIPTSNGAPGSNMVWSAAFSASAKSQYPKEAATFIDFMTDFDNTINVSLDTGLGVNALPSTKKTLDASTEQYTNWLKVYHPAMSEAASGILTNASRPGENVTLKNFASIMNETLVPTMDLIYLGAKTAKDAIGEVEETLKGKLQGTW
jgi:ABC-type glycerol-3-phosphate transport system substrate-binding protein